MSLIILFVFLRWCDILFYGKKNKVHKYAWHYIYYITVLLWEANKLMTSSWTSEFDKVWKKDRSYPGVIAVQTIWYMHCFLESWYLDRERRDYLVMMFHHVITIFLIYGANRMQMHRLALLVFTEQDIADSLINLCKLWYTFKVNRVVESILMVQLTVTWWVTRVGMLGYITIWACLYFEDGSMLLKYALFILWCMQVWWGVGLTNICIRFFKSGQVHDTFEKSD